MSHVQNQLPVFAQREVRTHSTLRAGGFAIVLMTFLCWSWWPFIRLMVSSWFEAPAYGVGFSLLILAFAIAWVRRNHVELTPMQPDGLGLLLVVGAIALRFIGTGIGFEFAEGASWVLALVGIAVVCTGRANLPWLLPPILFLGFLLPLPYRIGHAVAEPLQQAVLGVSTYFAQLCGYPAVASSKLLLVNDATIDIARRCVGLKCLVPFLALATGVAMLVNRPWWQRVFLVLSAVPVGIVLIGGYIAAFAITEANYGNAPSWLASYGLWIALAIALVVYVLELLILNRILVEPDVVPVSRGSRLKNSMPVVVPSTAEGKS
ncbi:MAG: exosortase/archaeosortase family protein [Planctomycetaceae bacterium]